MSPKLELSLQLFTSIGPMTSVFRLIYCRWSPYSTWKDLERSRNLIKKTVRLGKTNNQNGCFTYRAITRGYTEYINRRLYEINPKLFY